MDVRDEAVLLQFLLQRTRDAHRALVARDLLAELRGLLGLAFRLLGALVDGPTLALDAAHVVIEPPTERLEGGDVGLVLGAERLAPGAGELLPRLLRRTCRRLGGGGRALHLLRGPRLHAAPLLDLAREDGDALARGRALRVERLVPRLRRLCLRQRSGDLLRRQLAIERPEGGQALFAARTAA